MKNIQTFEEFVNESVNESYNLNGLCYNELGECMPKLSQSDLTEFCKEFVPQVNRPEGPLTKDIQDYLKKNKIECECSIEKVIGLLSGRKEYIAENVNEATTDGTYIFFYATNLTNIDYRKIFKGWEIKGVAENLSRDWVAFAKPIKSIDKAESEIESTIKKFPRENSITYQAGTYSNGKFELVKGSYRESGMETVFVKTLLELIEK